MQPCSEPISRLLQLNTSMQSSAHHVHFTISHSKSVVDPAPQNAIKTTRRDTIPQSHQLSGAPIQPSSFFSLSAAHGGALQGRLSQCLKSTSTRSLMNCLTQGHFMPAQTNELEPAPGISPMPNSHTFGKRKHISNQCFVAKTFTFV
jgi:hypothetical protein